MKAFVLAAVAALVSVAAPASAQDFTGARVGATVGYDNYQGAEDVAYPADLAHRVQVGVVRALMGPAQALRHVGQRGDLGRFRAALEAMRQDAVAAAHARAPCERANEEREGRFMPQC